MWVQSTVQRLDYKHKRTDLLLQNWPHFNCKIIHKKILNSFFFYFQELHVTPWKLLKSKPPAIFYFALFILFHLQCFHRITGSIAIYKSIHCNNPRTRMINVNLLIYSKWCEACKIFFSVLQIIYALTLSQAHCWTQIWILINKKIHSNIREQTFHFKDL